MKLSKPFMPVLRILMAGIMCLALFGALHLSSLTALAAPAHQTTGPNEAPENVQEQEGQNNNVNESVDLQEGQVDQQEGQNGLNQDGQQQDGQQDTGNTP